METIFWAVFAIVLAASVAVVAVVLRLGRGRTGIDQAQLAALRADRKPKPAIQAPAAQPAQVTVNYHDGRQLHQHLHLHGISPADVASATLPAEPNYSHVIPRPATRKALRGPQSRDDN